MGRTLKRRRLEAKTDYRARLVLLKSGKPRIVIRRSNRYIIAQIVGSDTAQDKIIVGVSSKLLLSKGWPKELSGSLKSRPAAYLTGLMLAKMAKGKVTEVILDIGMQRNISKSRLYAALNGFIDGGISVPHSQDILPGYAEISKNPKTGKLIAELKAKV